MIKRIFQSFETVAAAWRNQKSISFAKIEFFLVKMVSEFSFRQENKNQVAAELFLK